MAARAHAKRRNALNLTPIDALERVAPQPSPPSSALINVILEYADIQHEAGGGHLVLRLSHKRMKDPVIKSMLGRETKRLQDISILWDEAEGEIVRVCDAATGTDAPLEPALEESELDTFELTEAALAYLAAFPKRR
jgi:hypothetical protein